LPRPGLSWSDDPFILLSTEVVLADRATHEIALFDDVISVNHASGGLHVSPGDPTVYAWADLSAGVYRVRF
jgi:hypothetical protein